MTRIETEEHETLLQELQQVVYPWKKLTIAVDGINGVGKSNLARYLAWQLNMPCIDTDMFKIKNKPKPAYRYDELASVIWSRHKMGWPVIVEGVFLLDTMKQLGIKPDYLIYIQNSRDDTLLDFRKSLPEYLKEYDPEGHANRLFVTDFINVPKS